MRASKLFSGLLALSLTACILSGCAAPAAPANPTPTGSPAAATPAADPTPSADPTPAVNPNPNMNEFSAQTLAGDTFTQEDLKDYDLTMVNIWTTWCGYCVKEMPELQVLSENLPDKVNMISICADGGDEAELAQSILSAKGCTFAALVPDAALDASLTSRITAFPTTIFVDKDGNLVGEAQVGAPAGDVAAGYIALIENRLAMLQ